MMVGNTEKNGKKIQQFEQKNSMLVDQLQYLFRMLVAKRSYSECKQKSLAPVNILKQKYQIFCGLWNALGNSVWHNADAPIRDLGVFQELLSPPPPLILELLFWLL